MLVGHPLLARVLCKSTVGNSMFPPLLQSHQPASPPAPCGCCALKVSLDGTFNIRVAGKGVIVFELVPSPAAAPATP